MDQIEFSMLVVLCCTITAHLGDIDVNVFGHRF